jgi:hypothetical protein
MSRPSPRAGVPLLERVRHHIRLKHHSIRTEEAYVQAVRRFILEGRQEPSGRLKEAVTRFRRSTEGFFRGVAKLV